MYRNKAKKIIQELIDDGLSLKEISVTVGELDRQIWEEINKDVALNGKDAYVNPKLKPLNEY